STVGGTRSTLPVRYRWCARRPHVAVAPVAQGIEHRPPEAGAQARILPGAPRGMTHRLHYFKAGAAHDIDGLQGGVEVPVRRIAESRTRCLVRLSSPPGGGRPRQTEPTASRTFIRAARRAGRTAGTSTATATT